MLRDRGNIKWTAMMLPEHVAMLRKLKERENDKPKPIIDEQQFEQFNERMNDSIEAGAEIEITYYLENKYYTIVGKIRDCNLNLKELRIVSKEGVDMRICLENIIEVKYPG